MVARIPPFSEVRERLQPLTYAQVQRLHRLSRVPFTTLWNIRSGITGNPGIETVRKFWDFIPEAQENTERAEG